MLRRITSAAVALALAASFTLATTSPARAAGLTIKGTVTDNGTGLTMENVCITVGVPGQFCWTTTNAAGQYFIDLGALAAQPGQNWDIFFIRAGYDTKDQKVLVNGDETLNMALSVTPGATPPATIPPRTNVLNPPPPISGLPTFTVYLPNITKTLGGPSGWHTPFIVQNVGTANAFLTVTYYSFATGTQVVQRSAQILPGRSFVDSPRDDADLPDNTQFSVVISAAGAPVVAVVNEHQGPGAGNEALSYSGISTGSTSVYLPLVAKTANQWLTTMIMQNVGASTTTVTANFISLDGSKTAQILRTIDPGRSAFIDPRIELSLQDGIEYSATLTATQPIAVVANNHHDLPGATPAMGDSYNGVAVTANATVYMPYLAKNTDGVGRTSRVIVQNAGSTAATPLISVQPLGGGTATTITASQIQPGGAFVFAPNGPDGEYSAQISGGTFAAVATAISTTGTAMYYTGTTNAAGKIFVPNITRKLTLNPAVDPGWNTPILLQSATATSATLSWYRFSDGTLVTTQNVTLTTGATTRVDPALVTGLSDNNQYAVVINSSGTLVAIVTELNLVGGDDAMIYKGFPSVGQ